MYSKYFSGLLLQLPNLLYFTEQYLLHTNLDPASQYFSITFTTLLKQWPLVYNFFVLPTLLTVITIMHFCLLFAFCYPFRRSSLTIYCGIALSAICVENSISFLNNSILSGLRYLAKDISYILKCCQCSIISIFISILFTNFAI